MGIDGRQQRLDVFIPTGKEPKPKALSDEQRETRMKELAIAIARGGGRSSIGAIVRSATEIGADPEQLVHKAIALKTEEVVTGQKASSMTCKA